MSSVSAELVFVPPSVVIIGSFRRHLSEIGDACAVFRQHGIEVLSPLSTTAIPSSDASEFAVLETDGALSAKELQDAVLDKMTIASCVYLVSPDGSIGTSAAFEIGVATQMKCKIYASHAVRDQTLIHYLHGVASPLELCSILLKTSDRVVDSNVLVSNASVSTQHPHVFFDLDDTLINDQGQLQTAEHAVGTLVPNFHSFFIEIEKKNIPVVNGVGYGFGDISYVASFVEAFYKLTLGQSAQYDQVAFQAIEHRFKEILSKLIQTRQDNPEVFPDVHTTLQQLRDAKCPIHIISRGRHEEQMRKLVRAGIHHYFNSIHIVPKKDQHTYKQIAEKYAHEGRSLVMIGNSLKSDVHPAVAAGWIGIHVEPKLQWAFDVPDQHDDNSEKSWETASSIAEIGERLLQQCLSEPIIRANA